MECCANLFRKHEIKIITTSNGFHFQLLLLLLYLIKLQLMGALSMKSARSQSILMRFILLLNGLLSLTT